MKRALSCAKTFSRNALLMCLASFLPRIDLRFPLHPSSGVSSRPCDCPSVAPYASLFLVQC